MSLNAPLTLADGAIVFDAALSVRDLDTQYNITLPEDPAYATVGGFVLDQLGFIPKGGESFDYGNFRFSVMEMDGRRVARVKGSTLAARAYREGRSLFRRCGAQSRIEFARCWFIIAGHYLRELARGDLRQSFRRPTALSELCYENNW